jgi:hypothetical protein
LRKFKNYSYVLNENMEWMNSLTNLFLQIGPTVDFFNNTAELVAKSDLNDFPNYDYVDFLNTEEPSPTKFPDLSSSGFLQLANDMHNSIALFVNFVLTGPCMTHNTIKLLQYFSIDEGSVLKLLNSNESLPGNFLDSIKHLTGHCISHNHSL